MNLFQHSRQSSLRAVILILLSFGFSSVLIGCSGHPQNVSAAPEVLYDVKLVSVQRASLPDVIEAVGTVRSAQTSQISSQMMGTIVEIRAREGDRVHRGQVLAVIDHAQPQAAVDRAIASEAAAQQEVAAAESDFGLAEATFQRYKTLYDRKSVSAQEFDEIKARYQGAAAHRDLAHAAQAQAKAAVAEARTVLEYTQIRAPFDGIISDKKADTGVLASPGMPLFTIEDVRRYRLEASVNETDLRYIRGAQQAPVLIEAVGDKPLRGTVSEILPAADPGSRSFLVKVDLPSQPALRSGLFGRVSFSRGQRWAIVIPPKAVVQRGQLQGVYVVDQDKTAALRYLTLGAVSGDQVEVLTGLQPGEQLISDPADRDFAGKRIENR
jgi:RND family efflux transporter MFP subunit